MRPSYVLGGQNMIVAYNSADVTEYMGVITKHVDMSHPVLMDKYIPGHRVRGRRHLRWHRLPRARYHAAGRAHRRSLRRLHLRLPAHTFSQKVIDTLVDYTGRFARELKVVGLVNVQYAVQNDHVYVIEVNPRSSRTVPPTSPKSPVCRWSIWPCAALWAKS